MHCFSCQSFPLQTQQQREDCCTQFLMTLFNRLTSTAARTAADLPVTPSTSMMGAAGDSGSDTDSARLSVATSGPRSFSSHALSVDASMLSLSSSWNRSVSPFRFDSTTPRATAGAGGFDVSTPRATGGPVSTAFATPPLSLLTCGHLFSLCMQSFQIAAAGSPFGNPQCWDLLRLFVLLHRVVLMDVDDNTGRSSRHSSVSDPAPSPIRRVNHAFAAASAVLMTGEWTLSTQLCKRLVYGVWVGCVGNAAVCSEHNTGVFLEYFLSLIGRLARQSLGDIDLLEFQSFNSLALDSAAVLITCLLHMRRMMSDGSPSPAGPESSPSVFTGVSPLYGTCFRALSECLTTVQDRQRVDLFQPLDPSVDISDCSPDVIEFMTEAFSTAWARALSVEQCQSVFVALRSFSATFLREQQMTVPDGPLTPTYVRDTLTTFHSRTVACTTFFVFNHCFV